LAVFVNAFRRCRLGAFTQAAGEAMRYRHQTSGRTDAI
jgi:hypothetical protein